MRRTLITVVFIFSMYLLAHAQSDYKLSVGARTGLANGITLKTFVTEPTSLEFLLTTRWQVYKFTALFERNQDVFGTELFNFYYGLGGHVGYWEGSEDHPLFDDAEAHTIIGIDGIIGLEYTFEPIPFNLSLDWKPAFNIVANDDFWADELALSIRFIIN